MNYWKNKKKLESEKLGTPYKNVDQKPYQTKNQQRNKTRIEKKKKKNQVGLNINFTLKTEEIYEDLSFLSTPRSTSSTTSTTTRIY